MKNEKQNYIEQSIETENAKNYIKKSLDEIYPEIQGNIKKQLVKFKNYNFAQIARKENCHEDSTKLAKEIYYVIWGNFENNKYTLPELNSIENLNQYYGGETINTFNSLFQEDLEGIKFYIQKEENPNLYNQIEHFREKYLTIGNFMLLPKNSVNGYTLNTKKGSYHFRYKDYCDLFFYDLFETDKLNDLKESNRIYFKYINNAKTFFEKNLLYEKGKFEEFFDGKKPKISYLHEEKYYPFYWWKYSDENKKEHSADYKKFVENYIHTAEKMINYRADKICDILSERLSNSVI